MGVVVERVETATDEARALIAALEAELSGTYAAEQRHGLNVEQVFQPGVRFFIARLDGAAAGCGAIGLFDGFVELKRMYVRPEIRGRGVVHAILARLEAEAKALGYARVLLETGDVLHAAHRVYERAGYRRCDAFGDYIGMLPHTIARSVFMEKSIA